MPVHASHSMNTHFSSFFFLNIKEQTTHSASCLEFCDIALFQLYFYFTLIFYVKQGVLGFHSELA